MNALREFFSPQDLTYGRASLPYSEYEQKLRTPPFTFTEGRLPFPLRSDKDFIYYQSWALTTVPQRDVDIINVMGLNDYGGMFTVLPLLLRLP
jgi:hypothetical protein